MTLKRNVIANFAGSGWVALMSFAFVPFYIHFMGIESYGIVGFYVTLQSVLFLLDMGLTATVSRELSRLSVEADPTFRMRTLVRTLETLYLGISVAIVLAAIALSGWVAEEWLQVKTLSTDQVSDAVMLIGFVIAARMPFGFYCGGLIGLQQQVLMNIVKSAVETVRNGGAVLVLWLLDPGITTFFLWQAGVSVLGTCLMAFALWKRLPVFPVRPTFSKAVLQNLWRFAAGMSGIVFVSMLLVQMDKVVLSKMLPLDEFGYYTLAAVVAMSLYFVIQPVVTAFSPKLTQLVAADNQEELAHCYHQGCQIIAVMIFPVAITIASFSHEVLLLWTQDHMIAAQSYQVLSLLIIGTMLNGAMNVPYALQIAYGWTRLVFYMNLVLLLLLFPLLVIMTQQFGIIGAASVWVFLNALYVLVGIHLMHRRLIPGEKWKWYLQDLCQPLFASLLVVGSARLLVEDMDSQISMLLILLIILLLSFLSAVVAAPLTRGRLLCLIKQRYTP